MIVVALAAVPILACATSGATQKGARRSHRAATTPTATDAAWREFRPSEGDFTARFPDEPWERTQTVADDSGTAHIRTYQVTERNATYQIARNDFAEPIVSRAEARDLYDDGRAANLEDAGTRLLSERDVRLGGYIGREITFRSANGVERVRWFAARKRLYEIRIAFDDAGMTTAQRDAVLTRETRRFLDAFKLMDTRTPQFGGERKAKAGERR